MDVCLSGMNFFLLIHVLIILFMYSEFKGVEIKNFTFDRRPVMWSHFILVE